MPVISENPEFKVILASAQTGVLLGEVAPVGLSASIILSDVGSINFEFNLSHRLARKEFIEPYATDFLLMHKEHVVMPGIITAVGPDLDNRWLSIAGLDYLHYFDKRIWPFNPAQPTGNVYVKVNADTFVILDEILTNVLSLPDSLEVEHSLGNSGIMLNYRIEPGDTESILEKIRDLSEQEPGFDFEIKAHIESGRVMREFVAYSPSKGTRPNYVFEQGKNIKSLSYVDAGPTATDVFGFGAGTSTKVSSTAFNADMRKKYRRLESTHDFGSIIDKNIINRQTKAELDRSILSQRTDLRATIIPEPNFDIWTQVFVGDVCRVKGDTEYEQIDDFYRIISFDIVPTDTGDEEISVVFESET